MVTAGSITHSQGGGGEANESLPHLVTFNSEMHPRFLSTGQIDLSSFSALRKKSLLSLTGMVLRRGSLVTQKLFDSTRKIMSHVIIFISIYVSQDSQHSQKNSSTQAKWPHERGTVSSF